MAKAKRKDVVYYIENVAKDAEYGKCMTCKHYLHAMDCSKCYNNSRYCFDWKNYYENHKEDIDNTLL